MLLLATVEHYLFLVVQILLLAVKFSLLHHCQSFLMLKQFDLGIHEEFLVFVDLFTHLFGKFTGLARQSIALGLGDAMVH